MGNAARQPGDGYTILLSSSSIVVNPSLYGHVSYDVDKDFIPVTKAGASPNSWVVNPAFPARTMVELIDLIKREPGKHSVGSPGAGTTPSLAIEMLKLALGLDFITVPFAGGGPMTQSLLGSHTPIGCGALGNYANLIKEGNLRALAVTASKRSAALPEVPTLDELGIKDQESETMTGVFVPAATPKAIVDLLQREISTIVNTPDMKARLLQAGVAFAEVAMVTIGIDGDLHEQRPFGAGTRLHCLVHATPLYDTQGVRMGSVAVYTDITVRREAEDTLRT